MTNTFYYFEGRIFETLEEVQKATENYVNKKFDEIETEKDFNEFSANYEENKQAGESDFDAIEWAR